MRDGVAQLIHTDGSTFARGVLKPQMPTLLLILNGARARIAIVEACVGGAHFRF